MHLFSCKSFAKIVPIPKNYILKTIDVKIKAFKKVSWNGWDVKIRVQLQKNSNPAVSAQYCCLLQDPSSW